MSGTEIVTYERTVVPSVVAYQEQQKEQSLARYTPEQRTQLAFHESARYIEGQTDENGMCAYHAYPANLAHGYSLSSNFRRACVKSSMARNAFPCWASAVASLARHLAPS